MSQLNGNGLSFMQPRTPAEELIAALYGNLLSLKNVGINHSFFTLGGNRFLASQLLQQLREIFRVKLSLDDIFESPTVDSLVNTLSDKWGGREIVDEIAWIFVQVAQISDSEVGSMLQDKTLPVTCLAANLDGPLGKSQVNQSKEKRRLFELLLERTGISLGPAVTVETDQE